MLSKVKLPSGASKLRTNIEADGRNRNRMAKAKKGASPTQSQENFLVEVGKADSFSEIGGPAI
jgi:hypothetical protein